MLDLEQSSDDVQDVYRPDYDRVQILPDGTII